jgi:predicted transcriptional regulator
VVIVSQNSMEAIMDAKEWAKLQETILKSQLKAVRQILKEGEAPERKPRRKGRSQMSIIYDILLAAQKPLHVTDIIAQAMENFNVDLDRESIVSALTKKVKSGRMFKRVAPNTFVILDSTSENRD